jgi:hypothetical protein
MFVLEYVYNSFIYNWIKESGQYYVLLAIPVTTIFILSRKPIVKVECLLLGMKGGSLLDRFPFLLKVL